MDIYSMILKAYHESGNASIDVIEACLQVLEGDLSGLTAEDKSKVINWINNIILRVKSQTEKEKGTKNVNY